MANLYVDFVSDEDFLECIKWVCSAYPDVSEEVDIEDLKRNAIDPFKLVFDLVNGKTTVDLWVKSESMRQDDKTINNKIGEFHQKLLGKVKGWEDLKTGSKYAVDLRRTDNSIFIELKNKWNTMNSGGIKECHQRLKVLSKSFPKARCYWAYLIGKDGTSGEEVWLYNNKTNKNIKQVWGGKVYEIVTGDPESLSKTWRALPKAINHLKNSDFELNDAEQQKLSAFFEASFGEKSL
jgi:hypothetical protein